MHWFNSRRLFAGAWKKGSDWAFAATYGGLVAVALAFTRTSVKPFIYFQFQPEVSTGLERRAKRPDGSTERKLDERRRHHCSTEANLEAF